jgi:branched-subunit amino acid aminotransferase/4-amino-4-deoxychorismate lyase
MPSARLHPDISHPEVLLHTSTHILETATSNIAFHAPTSCPGEPQWITPSLTAEKPFLNGVMRQYLLEKGIVRDENVSIERWEQVKRDGTRVIGFNGLR